MAGGKQMTGTMKSAYNGGGSMMMNTGRRNTGPSSMMRQSNSVGHLSSFGDGYNSSSPPSRQAKYDDGDDDDDTGMGTLQGKKIKRTKSMWKFKKTGGGEVLTGMSMWKHRSLVDVNAVDAEEQQLVHQHNNNNNNYNNKSSAGTPVTNKKFTITCRDIDIAGGNGGGFVADDDDSQTIMNGGVGGGSSTVRRMTHDNRKQQQHRNGNDRPRSHRSSSSSFGGEDSESCIVVDDHLKDARSGRPAPAPASLLPRTRLIKQTGVGAASMSPVGTGGGGNGGVTSNGGGNAHQQQQQQQQQHRQGSPPMTMPPPPPPPAVRTATADDGYQHDSDADVRFESSKLQTFKYINATCNNDGWYDSWGEKRKK